MDPISGTIIFILILLFSVIFHEVAHGLMADRLGDPTARYSGRLTLNPIPHIDLFWSILLPGLMYWTTGGAFVFGAAKPVPVNFMNFRHIQRDMFLVAIVGPLTNLLLAVISAMVVRFTPNLSDIGQQLLLDTMSLNLVLAVFNLIPIPPLDGSKVLASAFGFFNRELMHRFLELERFGFIILIVVLFSGLLDPLVFHPVVYLMKLLLGAS